MIGVYLSTLDYLISPASQAITKAIIGSRSERNHEAKKKLA
jgi:hypothetical protein